MGPSNESTDICVLQLNVGDDGRRSGGDVSSTTTTVGELESPGVSGADEEQPGSLSV